MKKFIILILTVGVIAGFYFAFFYKTAEAPHDSEPVVEEEPVAQLEYTSSSKQIIKDGYEVDFKFPVTNEEKINTEINKVVDDMVSSFEKEAISFLPHPSGENRNYSLYGNFETHFGNKYDTVAFLVSVDFGGAHPNHFFKTITFDKNQNIVTLENFLNNEFSGLSTLDKISDLASKKIHEKLGENANSEMIAEGTKPSVENFDNFYVDGDTVVFLFEPYAVAPYAYSSQEARINFSEIRN